MGRPLAVDLFCGEGGASAGLYAAGFDVVGVDIVRRRRYPFDFVQGDALAPPLDLSRAALVWASPPCQAYSRGYTPRRAEHPRLVEQTRALLASCGALTIMENVPGAPMRTDVELRGAMFDLPIIRRRLFELGGWWCMAPAFKPHARGDVASGRLLCVVGRGRPRSVDTAANPLYRIDNVRRVMAMPWASRWGLSNAVPPAYAEFLGRAALDYMAAQPVAA